MGASVQYTEPSLHKAKAQLGQPAVVLEFYDEVLGWVSRNLGEPRVPNVPAATAATAWRIRADAVGRGWAWDVHRLRFFTLDTELSPSRAICSASASDDGPPGYGAEEAVLAEGMWGGRQDTRGALWVGAEFQEAVQVSKVSFTEPTEHCALSVSLERRDASGQWLHHRSVGDDEREEHGDEFSELPALGTPPRDCELVKLSSRPLSGEVADFSLRAALQQARPGFTPDQNFYISENCEGLWVCASKACGWDILRRACVLVRAVIPLWQRKLWSDFVSPKWAKDPGPMRIIILDNRSNEEAGCIPELQDSSTGRNGTSCPFVFTSREDFDGGVGGCWSLGALTSHEMTHGSDMVLRQQHDPGFHEVVGDLYAKHRKRFCWQKPTSRGQSVRKLCYAAANRDEFLAECLTISLGMMVDRADYRAAGLSRLADLEAQCPDVMELLRQHFSVGEVVFP